MSNTPISDLRTDDGKIDARSLNTGSVRPHTIVDATACYRLRTALRYGASLADHAAATAYGTSAAHHHATGDCDHDVAAPPLRHRREDEPMGTGRWVVR